jgi:hypothetical protein
MCTVETSVLWIKERVKRMGAGKRKEEKEKGSKRGREFYIRRKYHH